MQKQDVHQNEQLHEAYILSYVLHSLMAGPRKREAMAATRG